MPSTVPLNMLRPTVFDVSFTIFIFKIFFFFYISLVGGVFKYEVKKKAEIIVPGKLGTDSPQEKEIPEVSDFMNSF